MEQEPKWKYVASIYLKKKHVLVFRDNVLGLQLQVISRLSPGGGPPRKLYFVDGESTAYSTEADLLHARAHPPVSSMAGVHPLYIECMPTQPGKGRTVQETAPRFPTLFEQVTRWATGVLHRVVAAMHAVASSSRFPLHRLSR